MFIQQQRPLEDHRARLHLLRGRTEARSEFWTTEYDLLDRNRQQLRT